jgi:hypothetical protein
LRKKVISVIQYIFFLLIGLVLLYLVFRKLDLSLVWAQVKGARMEWLVFSLILGVMSHIARAIRWNILIKSMGHKTQTTTTFYAVMVGYLANAVFPRLGEVTRCAVLSKKTGVPFNSLFGTVISERVFDFIVLMTIIFAVIFLQLDFLRGFVDKYFLSSVEGYMNTQSLLILLLILFLVIIVPIIFFRVIYQKIKHFTFYKKLSDFVKGLLDGIKTIKRMPNKGAFLFWTGIIWLMYILMTYVAFFSLKATSVLTFVDSITLMALGSLGMVAPVPGGIGAYQFIVKAILVEIYHIASEPAASFSILIWVTQTILIIGVGIISYYLLLMKKTRHNEKTTD